MPRPVESIDPRLHSRRRLRIGVWCDNGTTTMLEQGIGIFVQNLVRGLLELAEPVEITLLVRPGDAQLEKVRELQELGGSRFRVIPRDGVNPQDAWALRAHRAAARVRVFLDRLAVAAGWASQTLKSAGRAAVRGCLVRASGGRVAALLAGSALVVFVAAASAAFVAWRLLRACGQTLVFPFHVVEYGLQALIDSPRSDAESAAARAKAAACDVWLLPYVGLDVRIELPSVVVIHDLVHLHYRDTFPAQVLARLEEIVPARAAEATICACMSDFIRVNDLEGMLRLPPEKVRVIRPAAPEDFPKITLDEARALKPAALRREYVLFPAAFRPYKNHRLLIEMLGQLSAEGNDWLDLVFTGFGAAPDELRDRIARLGLGDRVHILGHVDRRTLGALYMRAFATLVPSLYEQGSFPVYEALEFGCPVACSSIPSLREQCRSMGGSMLYFDPHDPADAARIVRRIRGRREQIRAAQQAAKASLWRRTWRDAAAEWLDVFHEVAELAAAGKSSREPRLRKAA